MYIVAYYVSLLHHMNIVSMLFHIQLFKAPYAVLIDNKMRSVIISIRGTMSLKVQY